MRYIRLAAATIACLAVQLAAAAAPRPEPPASRIDSIFALYTAGMPGCAVGVERSGRTLYAKAFGVADLQSGRALTPQSRIYMASVSKQVTAMAVLLLVQDGKLRLSQSIRDIVPELPDYASKVTIAQLLNHTSGVRDYFTLGELSAIPGSHAYTEGDVLRLLSLQKGLNFEPGSEFLYSNSGYVLLSIVVHRVSGRTLNDFATARIFTPLGMTHSRFQHDHNAPIPEKANGYQLDGGHWEVANSNLDLTGDGGLYSSVEDMLKWLSNLDHPAVGKSPLAIMRTPGRLNDGSATGYGMGLETTVFRGLEVIEHGGALAGYRTADWWFPQHELGVVVLCNNGEARTGQLAGQVATLFLDGDTKPASVPVALQPNERTRQFAGLYRGSPGNYVEFGFRDGKLVALPDLVLIEIAPGEFIIPASPEGPRIVFDADSRRLRIQTAGQPTSILEPVQKSDLTGDAGAQYAGEFTSLEVTDVVRIKQAGKLTFSLGSNPELALVRTGPDRLWTPVGGFELVFARDSTGAVNGFTLAAGRALGLKYERARPEKGR
jgi:CubicO group peptidase (beta-lactamase class C family)